MRNVGGEFGTTTGRPRRTGWFDAVIVKHSVRVNGLDGLAINKLDTLCGLGTLKICVGYKKPDGNVISDFPPTLEELSGCERSMRKPRDLMRISPAAAALKNYRKPAADILNVWNGFASAGSR